LNSCKTLETVTSWTPRCALRNLLPMNLIATGNMSTSALATLTYSIALTASIYTLLHHDLTCRSTTPMTLLLSLNTLSKSMRLKQPHTSSVIGKFLWRCGAVFPVPQVTRFSPEKKREKLASTFHIRFGNAILVAPYKTRPQPHYRLQQRP
jgi:hypothetical protein